MTQVEKIIAKTTQTKKDLRALVVLLDELKKMQTESIKQQAHQLLDNLREFAKQTNSIHFEIDEVKRIIRKLGIG